MSISSFTTVLMLDCRNSAMTIAVPKSTDIPNRVITFKDLYGSSITNNITLSTYNGDIFENGLNTLVISNSFQSVNLYAGLPGKWLNVGGSAATASGSGGIAVIPSFISALTLSTNLLTAVTISNTGIISTNTIGAGSAWITSLTAGAATTVGLSNTGFFSNSVGISTNTLGAVTANITTLNAGATATNGLSNTGFFSNSTGISTNTLGVATNMSVCNILSTNTLGAGSANITTLNAGASATIGLSNTGFFSNSTGISTNTLGVATNMSVCNILSTNTLGAGSANITTLNTGATTTIGLSNTGFFSNSTGISTNTLGVATNMSVCNILSTNTIGAGSANITTLTAGTTTTGGINNTSGGISNTGALSNTGLATFAGNLNMSGGTISNVSIISNSSQNLTINTLSTVQISINQTAGSDFTLFNNGDTRMRAVRSAYMEGVADAYMIAGANIDIRTVSSQYITIQQTGVGNQSYFQFAPAGNTVLNSRSYIELLSEGGSNGIYLTGSFTELRGYLTFNAVNNYINNCEAIYGDATNGISLNMGGASISIASDSNIYFTGNGGGGSSRYANFQETNVSFNTATPGSLQLNMNGNKITNVSNINFATGGSISNISIISNSSSDFSLNTSGKITTTAVSTINTVPNTVFTGQVTAGTALIGTPSAYGDTFAYFGHKNLPVNGSDYALLHEYNGTTFLNCSAGRLLRFRQNNIDIFTADAAGINMNCNDITNIRTMTFNTAAGTAQITGVYPNQLNIQAANVYILGNLNFYGTGLVLNMATNSITNVCNITGSGELPITAAAGCNVNLTGTYINLIANNVQFSSNFAMNSGTTAGVYNLNVQNGLNMYSNNITNVSNINFATGGSISNVNTIRTTALSTNTISTNAIMAYNISSYSITAYEGTISNLSSEFCGAYVGYFSTVNADTVSTITVNTDTLVVGGTQYGRLPIQSNATQLSNATTIITTPNTSYLFDDYYNLTNYITISNYGFQNGDFINIVNTGNSGTPATFNVLDGSVNPSTLIRYVYPGHAGVIVYSVNQWWPM